MTWQKVADNALLAAFLVGITWSFGSCTARIYEAQYRCVNLKVQP